MKDAQSILSDDAHVAELVRYQAYTLSTRNAEVDFGDQSWQLVSVSMSALYQASTCHRKCHGGPHILEGLSGRAYNLAAGAIALTQVCLYDEALNLIRGIGELSNLLLLFAIEPETLQAWIASDKKARLRDFSPAVVRKRLDAAHKNPVVTQDWYSDMCERFVHVQPGTRPNRHSQAISGFAGGTFQKEGQDEALSKLAEVVYITALIVCRYFAFDDITKTLHHVVESRDEA